MGTTAVAEKPVSAGRVKAGRSVQMNVRIDSELKREGDYALAQAGFTPSEAVRALYRLVAADADDPGRVRELLQPNHGGDQAPGASALDQARAAMDGFRERLGLSQGESLFDEEKDYKDVYADYLMERYYPEGGDGR